MSHTITPPGNTVNVFLFPLHAHPELFTEFLIRGFAVMIPTAIATFAQLY
jgi:hypothetical protein